MKGFQQHQSLYSVLNGSGDLVILMGETIGRSSKGIQSGLGFPIVQGLRVKINRIRLDRSL